MHKNTKLFKTEKFEFCKQQYWGTSCVMRYLHAELASDIRQKTRTPA